MKFNSMRCECKTDSLRANLAELPVVLLLKLALGLGSVLGWTGKTKQNQKARTVSHQGANIEGICFP